MPYQNFNPSPVLQEYLKCYWIAERELRSPEYSFEILPDSFIEMVFCYADQPVYYLYDSGKEKLPPVFILGLLNKSFTIQSKGWIHAMGIRFFAWGFFDLIQLTLNNPLLELEGQFNDLGKQVISFIGRDERLKAVGLMESFLLKQLEKAKVINRDIRVNGIAQKIYKDRGKADISALARDFYLSERHLNRLFSEKLGTGPKALSRKIRFQHIRDRIYENPDVNLTKLAYEYEYNDQAHFINDFKEFAGKTPGAFANEMRVLKESLNQYNVRFLQ